MLQFTELMGQAPRPKESANNGTAIAKVLKIAPLASPPQVTTDRPPARFSGNAVPIFSQFERTRFRSAGEPLLGPTLSEGP